MGRLAMPTVLTSGKHFNKLTELTKTAYTLDVISSMRAGAFDDVMLLSDITLLSNTLATGPADGYDVLSDAR